MNPAIKCLSLYHQKQCNYSLLFYIKAIRRPLIAIAWSEQWVVHSQTASIISSWTKKQMLYPVLLLYSSNKSLPLRYRCWCRNRNTEMWRTCSILCPYARRSNSRPSPSLRWRPRRHPSSTWPASRYGNTPCCRNSCISRQRVRSETCCSWTSVEILRVRWRVANVGMHLNACIRRIWASNGARLAEIVRVTVSLLQHRFLILFFPWWPSTVPRIFVAHQRWSRWLSLCKCFQSLCRQHLQDRGWWPPVSRQLQVWASVVMKQCHMIIQFKCHFGCINTVIWSQGIELTTWCRHNYRFALFY